MPVDIDLAAVEFGAFDPHALAAAFGELRFTSLLDRALALRGDGRRRAAGCAAAAARGRVPQAGRRRQSAAAAAPAPPRAAESGRAC